ncbi:MAG: hypothetical protein IT560_05250 [Alphaproteobacteria bacterium]|nr:hypothetical protein [Alphaproteobacteria bacterium]
MELMTKEIFFSHANAGHSANIDPLEFDFGCQDTTIRRLRHAAPATSALFSPQYNITLRNNVSGISKTYQSREKAHIDFLSDWNSGFYK